MSNDRLMSRFQEDLTRNEECVRLMDKPKMRGNIAGKLALGDSSSGFAPAIVIVSNGNSSFGNGERYYYTDEDDVAMQMMECDSFVLECPDSYNEGEIDHLNHLRPGYKGRTPNLFKSCEPCSKVKPKDVAKRRAKNKIARKNKRK